ncbi:MAG TPA: hypothetical protein VGF69_17485 [Thermoanaerobaculia bacterium]|jgi:hypothetical protein
MNELRYEAEIARGEGIPAAVIRERVYGNVRVIADWPADLGTPEIRLEVKVRGDVDRRDAPAYVELFFHDLFLLLNLSAPASFGGTVSITGGELRVRELTFSTRIFEYAEAPQRLPLADVVAWYDGLQLGTQQLASTDEGTALFQLLHLARADENEETSILRLGCAVDALGGRRALPRLFELRRVIANGEAPIVHPMHDDALDTRVGDMTSEWIEVGDAAATFVIRALQERVMAR